MNTNTNTDTSTEHSTNTPVPAAVEGVNTNKRSKRRKPAEGIKSLKSDEVTYAPEFAILICERIASSPRSLFSICSDPDMPSRATLFRWLRDHPDFQVIYREAKEAQADILIEQGLDIIDDDSNDVITTADGRTIMNMAAIHRSKARVEYRKWIASKLLPRKYGGDRQISQSTAVEEPKPEPQTWETYTGGPMSEEVRLGMIEERRRYYERCAAEEAEHQAAIKAAVEAAKAEVLAQFTAQYPDLPPLQSNSPSPNSDLHPSPEPRRNYDMPPTPKQQPREYDHRDFVHPVRYI